MKYKARLTKAKTMFLPINLCCRRSDKKRKKKWKVEKWWLIYSFNIRKHRRELMKNRNEQEREEEEEEQEPNTSWSSVSRSRGIRGRPQSRLPELGWRRLGLGADPPPVFSSSACEVLNTPLTPCTSCHLVTPGERTWQLWLCAL